MNPSTRTQGWAVLIGACVFAITCAPGALARQSDQPADTQPKDKEPAAEEPRKVSNTLPGLDDLLGLPGAQRPRDGESDDVVPPLDRDADALERKLTAAEMADKFREAIREMGQLADLLERSRDTGLQTQRLHEEVINKLDALIKSSKSSSSSSSSSSESSSSSDDPAAPNQPKPGQGDQSAEASQGENQGESMPPGFQSPELRGRLDVARAAWGALPERVRQSLLQGSSDQFSSLYEQLTEEYYRRLAEEARQ